MTIPTQPRALVLTAPREAPASPASFDERRAIVEVQLRIDSAVRAVCELWRALSPPDPAGTSLAPDDVLDLLADFVGSGGKRLRPRMAYWGWVAAGGPTSGVGRDHLVTVGAALELLHAFALVHDDVMDGSQQRRGRPAVHVRAAAAHARAGARGDAGRYGESVAILVGDLLQSEANVLVGGLPASMRAGWRILATELMAGQARDLAGAAAGRRDLVHARQVASMKSGAYTVWRPLQLGALAAGAGERTLAALHGFGLHLGEAFALRDDLLGVLGDPQVTGKPAGDDILAGKPTVLLALADQQLPAAWRGVLSRAGDTDCGPADVAGIVGALVDFGIVEQVEGMIARAVEAGCAALDDPAVDPRAAQGLRMLADRVAWRVS